MADAKKIAKNVEKMFGVKTVVHSQDPKTGNIVVKDTSGNIVSNIQTPINPNTNKPFNVMEECAAICIKENNLDYSYPKVGDKITVTYMPNGKFYINSLNGDLYICNDNAVLNVDFKI